MNILNFEELLALTLFNPYFAMQCYAMQCQSMQCNAMGLFWILIIADNLLFKLVCVLGCFYS